MSVGVVVPLPAYTLDPAFIARKAEELGFAEWSTEPAAAKNCIRLCFAYPSEEEIYEGIARLAAVFRRETGIPPRSANVAHE